MTQLSSPPAGGERIHALDAVRGGALLLGVAFHATMSFLPGPQIWVVRDAPDPVLGGLFFVAHMFRMTLFFLVAGFFARMLVERGGAGGFVRDRGKRIVLPLLVFWLPVMAAMIGAFAWGAAAMNGGTLPATPAPTPPMTLATFPLGHLWFLYVLTLFYLAALAVRRFGRAPDGLVRFAVQRNLGVLLLGLPMFAVLAAKADWMPSLGVPTPDMGFVPNLAAIAAYGTAFGFGWLLNRQPGLLQAFARVWPVHLGVAMAATAILILSLGGVLPVFAPEVDGARRAVLAALYALGAWSWTLGLLGAALRFLSRPNAAVRYCADASYWIYLVHIPVVMALQVAVYPIGAPALVKFALVLAGAFLILFASYHLLVRHSWIGRWLNGRSYQWRAAKPAMEVVPA
jgi:peptidoglycan/LPS O-acetylase OafA/YrhL